MFKNLVLMGEVVIVRDFRGERGGKVISAGV